MRTERGSGTLLMTMVIAAVVVVAIGCAIVGVYAISTHRARAGADLAALSGADGKARGPDACAVAEATARQNGVRLVGCTLSGDQWEYVVAVRVEVPVDVSAPGLPRAVAAEAHAGRTDD